MKMQQCKNLKNSAIYKFDFKKKFKLGKNSIIPLLAIILFGITVIYWNTQNYGLALECNGKVIAAVAEDSTYLEARRMLTCQLAPNSKAAVDAVQTEVRLAPVSKKECCVTPNEVRNKIIEQSQEIIVEGAGIYINDKLVGVCESADAIDDILSKMLENAKGENPDSDVEAGFSEKVEVIKGIFTPDDVQETEDLEKLLVSGEEKITEHEVIEGDTILGVAEKLGINTEELFKINGGEQSIYVGDVLKIKSTTKILNVKVYKIEAEEKEIPFTTVTKEDSVQPVGWKKTTSDGKKGLEIVKSKVTYVDGKEQSREEIERQTIIEPVEENVVIGTQKKQIEKKKQEEKKDNNKSKSKFRWPVPHTTNITSGYGKRGGGVHNGIDIACRGVAGKNIVAAKDGVVEFASNGRDGYGNCVKIRHAGGVKTLYGHCQTLCVKAGQKVEEGQVIGTVGNTGESRGHHLHFGVSCNGAWVDPRKYV